MAFELSLEPWEEIQRYGFDLADRLSQGLNALLQSPPPFPNIHRPSSFVLDVGHRLGQAGADLGAGFGASFNGVVDHLFRQLRMDGSWSVTGKEELKMKDEGKLGEGLEELGLVGDQLVGRGLLEHKELSGLDGFDRGEEEEHQFEFGASGGFGKHQGSINLTSTYDSRTNGIETSVVARGDIWRLEASQGSAASRNENSPIVLVQLGPVLFVRDTTLLLPVHVSKQHLLWYGYDRKNGLHSLCPTFWSKHRRWLLMSMICLSPFSCTFMDFQFPNGQLTYVAGESLTASAFLPAFGGLLQVHGQYPGEAKFSFSCKNKNGTTITPMVQWPDQSFSLGVAQTLAWKRSGLLLRPRIQCSLCPTFGGSNHGLHAEVIHSLTEKLSLSCGYSCTNQPSAFASMALGRSENNSNFGRSGVVVRVEAPTSNVGRPSFSVQLNSGVEF